jgi:hypothetical protein
VYQTICKTYSELSFGKGKNFEPAYRLLIADLNDYIPSKLVIVPLRKLSEETTFSPS